MMETTTARQRNTHPINYYWNVVKDMNDSQKLELITLLAESIKPQMTAEPPMRRYTMDEINAMLDEAEAEIAAGGGIPDEEAWNDLEEELAREEQQEPEMVEAL